MFTGLPHNGYQVELQAKKVYRSEKLFDRQLRLPTQSLEELQEFLDRVVIDINNRFQLSIQPILIYKESFFDYSHTFVDRMYLIQKHMTKTTVLHELAHIVLIDTKYRAKHCAVFCSLFLWLLHTYVSESVANQMRAIWEENGVKFIPRV